MGQIPEQQTRPVLKVVRACAERTLVSAQPSPYQVRYDPRWPAAPTLANSLLFAFAAEHEAAARDYLTMMRGASPQETFQLWCAAAVVEEAGPFWIVITGQSEQYPEYWNRRHHLLKEDESVPESHVRHGWRAEGVLCSLILLERCIDGGRDSSFATKGICS